MKNGMKNIRLFKNESYLSVISLFVIFLKFILSYITEKLKIALKSKRKGNMIQIYQLPWCVNVNIKKFH